MIRAGRQASSRLATSQVPHPLALPSWLRALAITSSPAVAASLSIAASFARVT